jgi:hypothetical protein
VRLFPLQLVVVFVFVSVGFADGPTVKWANDTRDAVRIVVDGEEEFFTQCIRSGFEARMRFEVGVCRRREGWFDRCSETFTEVHALRYDAVADAYLLTRDRWGDAAPPTEETVGDAENALRGLAEIGPEPLAQHGWAADGRRYYIKLRAVADCKGEYNELLARIPYLLTLGLVRVNGYDSGTVTFSLDGQPTR